MRTRDLLRSLGWKLSRKGIWTNPNRKSSATAEQAENQTARWLGFGDWSKYGEAKRWTQRGKGKELYSHFADRAPYGLKKPFGIDPETGTVTIPAQHPNAETLRKYVYNYGTNKTTANLDALLRYLGWRDGSEPYKAGETPRRKKTKKGKESAGAFFKRIDRINKAIVANSRK